MCVHVCHMCVYIVYHSDNRRKKLDNFCILLFNHHKIFTCLNNFNDIDKLIRIHCLINVITFSC